MFGYSYLSSESYKLKLSLMRWKAPKHHFIVSAMLTFEKRKRSKLREDTIGAGINRMGSFVF